MRNDPKKYLTYRKFVESELNGRFRLILNGTEEQKEAREVGSSLLQSHLDTHVLSSPR